MDFVARISELWKGLAVIWNHSHSLQFTLAQAFDLCWNRYPWESLVLRIFIIVYFLMSTVGFQTLCIWNGGISAKRGANKGLPNLWTVHFFRLWFHVQLLPKLSHYSEQHCLFAFPKKHSVVCPLVFVMHRPCAAVCFGKHDVGFKSRRFSFCSIRGFLCRKDVPE